VKANHACAHVGLLGYNVHQARNEECKVNVYVWCLYDRVPLWKPQSHQKQQNKIRVTIVKTSGGGGHGRSDGGGLGMERGDPP